MRTTSASTLLNNAAYNNPIIFQLAEIMNLQQEEAISKAVMQLNWLECTMYNNSSVSVIRIDIYSDSSISIGIIMTAQLVLV